jgi:hypothetical protein
MLSLADSNSRLGGPPFLSPCSPPLQPTSVLHGAGGAEQDGVRRACALASQARPHHVVAAFWRLSGQWRTGRGRFEALCSWHHAPSDANRGD